MLIALVSPSWPMALHANGIVTYVHHLREELLRQGHCVSVFSGRIAPGCTEPGVHPVRHTPLSRLRRRVAQLLGRAAHDELQWGRVLAVSLLEVHRTDPIDVVEMEESFGWCADVRRIVRVPLVVKLHGPAFMSFVEEEAATPRAQRRIAREGVALRRIEAITSPSRDTLDRTVAHLGLAPAIAAVVPNPIAVDADVEQWDAARCDPQTVLFVGRFDKRKGGDIVLHAFCRLLERDPHARLVFVGPDYGLAEGGAPVRFDDWCRRELTPAQRARIDYRGAIPRAEIFRLRTQAAVTVIASRWDNQPNTVLEAMLQACPVVAARSGGVDELIEHGRTGRLARPNDADDLAAQLAAVLDDLPAAAPLGRAAREAVLRRHATDTLAAQTLAVYRQAIEQQRSGRPVRWAERVARRVSP
ncbi:MAG: glycosyltransferase family 4 protein [Rhizobacter sp.]